MKFFAFVSVLVLAGILQGCGSEDAEREKALHEMPVLWESEIVVADPEMPDMTNVVAMFDSHDASLAEAWQTDKFTEDYIPESVKAFSTDTYRDNPRTITIQIGDRVSVLARKKNNTRKEVCLVRTQSDTFAWLYAFHLCDENGNRLGKL